MNETAYTTHGALSWCELMTSDREQATAFYTELLGWQLKRMEMPGLTYDCMMVGEQGVGGIMTSPVPDMPPAWGVYITVDDVDKRAARAESLGGKVVVPPTDIPTVGRFCGIQDPQGAVLYLITYVKK